MTAITVQMTGNVRRNKHILALKRLSKTAMALGIKLGNVTCGNVGINAEVLSSSS